MLESGRHDDFQYPQRPVAGVPEGVPVTAGFEDEVARLCNDFVRVLDDPEPALEHEAVLVLSAVSVQWRCEHPRCEPVLDERDQAGGVLTFDQVAVQRDVGVPGDRSRAGGSSGKQRPFPVRPTMAGS